MKTHELHKLIRKGESQTLDFKKEIPQSYKIAKTLAAFSNTRGGRLLIGVLDNGDIMGTDPHEESFKLQKAAEHFCRPPVALSFSEAEDELGRVVLIAEVMESEQKPHYALGKSGNWQCYVRANDKSVLAGEAALKTMKQGFERENSSLSKQERAILDSLLQAEKLTARQATRLFNLSERRVRRTLVAMVRKGLLFSHDFEQETFYTLA